MTEKSQEYLLHERFATTVVYMDIHDKSFKAQVIVR